MSSYIEHRKPWGVGFVVTHCWRADLHQRLAWLYGDALERMRQGAPNVTVWHFLGKPKPPAWEPPEAA